MPGGGGDVEEVDGDDDVNATSSGAGVSLWPSSSVAFLENFVRSTIRARRSLAFLCLSFVSKQLSRLAENGDL